MAIFGHMTAGKNGSGAPAGPGTDPSSSSGADPTASDVLDLEASLESLSKTIDDAIAPHTIAEDRERRRGREEVEPPHFTLATSPTRTPSPHKED